MDCWVDFGKIWWPVVLGILEEVVLGCCCGYQVVGGGFRDGLVVEWVECIAGSWVDLGDGFGRVLKGCEGSGLQWDEGGGNADFC